jgi:hypothetical protein
VHHVLAATAAACADELSRPPCGAAHPWRREQPHGLRRPAFPTRPLYTGVPWFMPAIGSWYACGTGSTAGARPPPADRSKELSEMFEFVDTGIVPPRTGQRHVRAGNMLFMAHTPKDRSRARSCRPTSRCSPADAGQSQDGGGGRGRHVARRRPGQDFLIDSADAPGMNRVYREIMPEPFPNRRPSW